MSAVREQLDPERVRRSFDAAAATYDGVAVLQREVGKRLLGRLDPLRIDPAHILDLGCGTGAAVQGLLSRYPKARVIGADLSRNMLERAQAALPWSERWLRRRVSWVCADLHALPFPTDCFQLVFSNLTLQWSRDVSVALDELQRVTAPGGAVMFTTFGPRTLSELRDAWSQVDRHSHVHEFTDLHDVGDAMLQAGYLDPVIDSEDFTLTYQQPREAMRELKLLGARNAAKDRARSLMSPHRLAQVEAAYKAAYRLSDGRVPVTYEVVYGHAWGIEGRPQRMDSTGEVRIDPSTIQRRRR